MLDWLEIYIYIYNQLEIMYIYIIYNYICWRFYEYIGWRLYIYMYSDDIYDHQNSEKENYRLNEVKDTIWRRRKNLDNLDRGEQGGEKKSSRHGK